MNWPSRNPDLNFIEGVWDHVDREQNERQPTATELWNIIQEEIKKIAKTIKS